MPILGRAMEEGYGLIFCDACKMPQEGPRADLGSRSLLSLVSKLLYQPLLASHRCPLPRPPSFTTFHSFDARQVLLRDRGLYLY